MEKIQGNNDKRHKTSIAMIGKQGTGKTQILNKLAELYMSAHQNNIVRTRSKLELTTNDSLIEISEVSLASPFYLSCNDKTTKADAFIIVYGIDDNESFDCVGQVKDFIRTHKGETTPILVVGNKSDVPDRKVPFVVADCMVTIEWEMEYLETSTTTGNNIRGILPTLVENLQHNSDEIETYELNGVTFRRKSNSLSTSRSANFKQLFSSRSPSSVSLESPNKEYEERPRKRWFSLRRCFNRGSATPDHHECPRTTSRRKSSLTQLLVCVNNDSKR